MQVSPDTATEWSFNTPSLTDGMSLLWTLGGGQNPQPRIDVSPASLDFGTVAVNSSVDLSFVVENTGTGTLAGQAQVPAPFSIVSGGSYTLAAGDTQIVVVRFRPTAAGTFIGNVSFTGGGGAVRAVTGAGSPDAPGCGPIAEARLKVAKLGTPGGMTLGFKGAFALAPGDVAQFDPVADGIGLVLRDGGAVALDLDLPGGLYDARTRRGWLPNGNGTVLTYRDASANPVGGVTSFQVKRSAQAPQLVSFKVKGKNGTWAVSPAVVGEIVLDGGACFAARFAGPPPGCTYNGGHTTLTCR